MDPNRRDRVAARTREDILLAASKALARGGFHATTMQQIGKEAGYTAAALYTYFESKQEIFEALVEFLLKELFSTFDQVFPSSLTFPERMELLVRRQFELFDRRRDAFAFFFSLRSSTNLAEGPQGDESWNRGIDCYCGRLTQWLADNAQAQELGGLSAEDAAFCFVGIADAFFRRWVQGGSGKPLGDQTGLILNLFLYGVAGGAALKSSSR
jgi:AcrR family transcriptional regulator